MPTRAPITIEHHEPGRFLGPLDDGFPAQAEQAFEQPVGRMGRRRPEELEPLHCRAYLKDDLRLGRMGILEVTLQIKWDNRDQALDLLELATYPMEMYLRPCRRD
jgi:hypothetical protein